jgi:hypothetical protein
LSGAAAALLLSSASATDQVRWHFVFETPVRFEYSVLFTRAEKGDTTRLLLQAPSGRYELVSSQDPTDRDSTESIRALGPGETFTRRLVLTRAKDVAGCEAVEAPDACVVLTGPRGTLASGFSAFSGKGAARLRARGEALLSPALKQSLLELAALFPSSAELDRYGEDMLGLLWPERFGARRAQPREAARAAGCAFDRSFGHPCSPAEERREATRFGVR